MENFPLFEQNGRPTFSRRLLKLLLLKGFHDFPWRRFLEKILHWLTIQAAAGYLLNFKSASKFASF
ncbi:MAG: hypothetical protein ACXWF8_17810 [Methylobacter sp.]